MAGGVGENSFSQAAVEASTVPGRADRAKESTGGAAIPAFPAVPAEVHPIDARGGFGVVPRQNLVRAAVSGDREQDILRAAVSGDRDALAELLRLHDVELRDRLRNAIGRRYRSAIDVADVVQVTYLEAFLQIRGFRPGGPRSFLAWLTAIARHNLQDAIRGLNEPRRPPRKQQIESSLSDESYVVLLASVERSASTPSRHLSKAETRERLEGYLKKLPPDYERVIRLKELQQLSYSEVAAAMGRSRGAVYMLYHRAMHYLRELMGTGSTFFAK